MESTEHFLTRCLLFIVQRRILISNISDAVRNDFSVLPDDYVSRIVLYGSERFNDITNNLIIQSTIKYIMSTKRFNKLEAFSQSNINTGTPQSQVWVGTLPLLYPPFSFMLFWTFLYLDQFNVCNVKSFFSLKFVLLQQF